jgi:aspartyl-tRNA(Asn)/glutamyl-tRNA(Gln) amidotransferase subunit B
MATIKGKTGEWEMVIGLEVHAQVISKSKLFSGASTEFGAEPNSQVSLVDAAMPGMLPVLNRYAVEQAVRTGLGLKAKINLTSVFERKNYFYADLPQGYQISQYLHPIVGEGTIVLDLEDGETREVGIERLHLEQDAGKSIHDQHPTQSYIDLNRSGVTLMEIVSKPDMRSAEEAGAYLRKLRTILRYLGTCDGNMDEGSMRADVNLSMRRPGEPLGTRTETKNVNSIRYVQQAIELEARRQVQILEDGGAIVQETRLFNAHTGTARSMRSKEEAHDYRYFPDPDLLPLELDADWVKEIEAGLPELPDEKKARFMTNYGLPDYTAGLLVVEKQIADFYEETLRRRASMQKFRAFVDAKDLINTEIPVIVTSTASSTSTMVVGDYFGALNRTGTQLHDAPVDAEKLARLLDLVEDGTISGRIAKEVFEEMWENGKEAGAIVEAKGLKQISDSSEIEGLVDDIIANNPTQVAQYKGGNEKIIGWFVGQVMKATQGKANPGLVNQVLKKKLD